MTPGNLISALLLFVYVKFFVLISFSLQIKVLSERNPFIQVEYNNLLPDTRILLVPDDKRKILYFWKSDIPEIHSQIYPDTGYQIICKLAILTNNYPTKIFLFSKQLRV